MSPPHNWRSTEISAQIPQMDGETARLTEADHRSEHPATAIGRKRRQGASIRPIGRSLMLTILRRPLV